MDSLFVPVYRKLRKSLGPSHWWPGETPFEVMVGAILTQNTNWKNVEKSLKALRDEGLLNPEPMAALPAERLALLIRSSGYYNQKAKKLKAYLDWYGGYRFSPEEVVRSFGDRGEELRQELLSLFGVGPETADSILCYAFQYPYFVVDAYTLRWLGRYRSSFASIKYEPLRALVEREFRGKFPTREMTSHLNEFHALMVRLSHTWCQKRKPDCETCALGGECQRAL